MSQPTQVEVLAWVTARWPNKVDPQSRALKLGEEAGEVLGAVVKMSEGRMSRDDLAEELAQLVLCAMALAQAVDVSLDAAVADEWDRLQIRTWPGTAA